MEQATEVLRVVIVPPCDVKDEWPEGCMVEAAQRSVVKSESLFFALICATILNRYHAFRLIRSTSFKQSPEFLLNLPLETMATTKHLARLWALSILMLISSAQVSSRQGKTSPSERYSGSSW